ncbi:hypothetical protein GOBAR_DD36148 [Gossypium barbadense]|nr:hypothetical protein GOBAR_DD36148 [Gossypium barbadense]
MDRQTTLEVGEAIGEVLAIDWRDREGCWTEFIRVKVKLDISKPLQRVVYLVGRKEKEIFGNWLRVQPNENAQARGNWRNGVELIESKTDDNTETNEKKAKGGEEELESGSPIEKQQQRIMHDGGGRVRGKRKRIRGGNGENMDESPAKTDQNAITGFYGHADPNQRKKPWDVLKGVGRSIKETWIVEGDFNAIVTEVEKKGGRRKSRVLMDEFSDVI